MGLSGLWREEGMGTIVQSRFGGACGAAWGLKCQKRPFFVINASRTRGGDHGAGAVEGNGGESCGAALGLKSQKIAYSVTNAAKEGGMTRRGQLTPAAQGEGTMGWSPTKGVGRGIALCGLWLLFGVCGWDMAHRTLLPRCASVAWKDPSSLCSIQWTREYG